MKILITLLFFTLIYSSDINNIAIKVNSDIITSYDIQTAMKEKKLNKKKAIDFLINGLIKKKAIEESSVDISSSNVKNQINQIAMSLSISSKELKSRVLMQMKWSDYISNLKLQMQNSGFEKSVITRDIQNKDDSFFEEFYKKNKDKFAIYKTIKVIIYSSTNQRALQNTINNPMSYDKNINQTKKTIRQETFVDKNTYKFLSNMKEKTFSPIINTPNSFISYFVVSKKGSFLEPYSKDMLHVKNLYAIENKDKIIEKYLNGIKINSKIVYMTR